MQLVVLCSSGLLREREIERQEMVMERSDFREREFSCSANQSLKFVSQLFKNTFVSLCLLIVVFSVQLKFGTIMKKQ
jgi:hypothetical protein